MSKLAEKKNDYNSLTWRGALLLVGAASLEFLLPASWARWLWVVGIAAATIAILVVDSAKESPGLGVALGICAAGALLFWLAALSVSPKAFFAGQPVSAETMLRTWLTCGAAFFIAGVAFGVWRTAIALLQWLRRMF